jgi:hypothetical protein
MTLDLEKKTSTFLSELDAFEINNDEDFKIAGEKLTGLKTLTKEVKKTFDPIIKKSRESWKENIAQSKKYLDPLVEKEIVLKSKISIYVSDKAEKERIEQRRLEEEARKKQEEQALTEASLAETKEEAEEIMKEAIEDVPVVIPTPKTKVKGISTFEKWDFKIVDESKIDRKFLKVDETKIRKQVNALGHDAESIVGGIKAFKKTIVRGI